MALGDNIKRFRELRELSVPDLAKIMGINKAGIYKWEDGTTVPGGNKLTDIANALGVSVADLLDENITSVENEPAIPQKTPLKETFYRELIEDNENYSLIPKAILSDYKIVPEKLLDMITQSKDELNGELKEKHKLIIQGYENRINRLEEDKSALLAENERLKRQIPAKNE